MITCLESRVAQYVPKPDSCALVRDEKLTFGMLYSAVAEIEKLRRQNAGLHCLIDDMLAALSLTVEVEWSIKFEKRFKEIEADK